MRHRIFAVLSSLFVIVGVGTWLWPPVAFLFGPLLLVLLVFIRDVTQTRHAILRNYPVIGHGRYLLESIRPEINQYFIESNTDGAPFNREMRSLVYQRAKGELDTVPFGTQRDLYTPGSEWLTHSIVPADIPHEPFRVTIGAGRCAQPYSASLLNVSAMSFGALSKNAILALNSGAKAGGFAHNTGEGGVSRYHLEGGGDLIWQVGTGYFGCRAADGGFDSEKFRQTASHPQIKMIELKISQGAKPAHGGILPAHKLTREISEIRGVVMGKDVLSPPRHSAFSTPRQLVRFVAELRELSLGKPVGIKLCIGKRREFLAICKAMLETGDHPDYVAVDGAEGGTGAAPLEFTNSLGLPLTDALVFVHNALVGVGLRDKVKVFASGKVSSGFHMARLLCLGADACYSARAMMMAIGCIQARRCNNNKCPTGVATQDPRLVEGLDVADKAERVRRFQHQTVHSFMELLAACGFSHPSELRPWNLQQRLGPHEIKHFGELYDFLTPGALLAGTASEYLMHLWRNADADTFNPKEAVGSVMPPPPKSLRLGDA
jgi:glutamate synthase domain-containing protein 2